MIKTNRRKQMNKKFFLRGFLMLLVLSICLPTFFYCQEDSKTAPIPIIDFEGTAHYREFPYFGPNVDYEFRLIKSHPRFVKQGQHSRLLKWNFNAGKRQYFGWGVDLKHAGEAFDTRKANFLTFWVIGVEGGERFHIKLKDINGLEVPLNSHIYVTVSQVWQKVSVPLADFGRIDLSRLENVNLGFDLGVSGARGCIYIDDFAFEY
jgi:hypothetical protein